MRLRWALIGMLAVLLRSAVSSDSQQHQAEEADVTDRLQHRITPLEEAAQILHSQLDLTTDNVSLHNGGNNMSLHEGGLEKEGTGFCIKEPAVFPWRRNQTTTNYVGTCSSSDTAGGVSTEVPRPKCEEGKGCDRPLNCFDFRSLGNDSVVPDPPSVLKVTPHMLEGISENVSIQNCCAIVMFYAPWCEFSAQFGRKFNALGRTFSGLPILAVDLNENEPYKYILAYLPVVAFYYQGKVMFRFRLSASYEELRDTVANMTGFTPGDVDLMDEANELPVPTERVDGDGYSLLFAGWWLVFVVLVLVLKSSRVLDFVRRIELNWTKT